MAPPVKSTTAPNTNNVAEIKPGASKGPPLTASEWAMAAVGGWRATAIMSLGLNLALAAVLFLLFVSQPERSLATVADIYERAMQLHKVMDEPQR